MEKLGCLIGIITACFVTILVLTTDVGNFDHTVTISSQQTSFSGGNNTEISSTDVKLSNNVNVLDTSYFFFCCAQAYIEVDVACFSSCI